MNRIIADNTESAVSVRAKPSDSCHKRRNMKARVTVTLKTGILDPQGKAIEGALRSLGVAGVSSVRQGKVFDIEIEGTDRAQAEALLKQAADKLLANTVIENYRVEVVG
jgi:phosphoribosylformylglycinamidine synthase